MKRKRPSPRDSEGDSSVVFGALVAAALTALCTVAAVLLVAPRARGAVAVCGLVAAVAVGLACAEIRRRDGADARIRPVPLMPSSPARSR